MNKTAVGVGVGVGAGIGALLVWAWRRKGEELPTEWEEVGVVSRLNVFPLKSGRALNPDAAQATPRGMVALGLRDRSFLVVRAGDGQFLTGRQCPKLTTVDLKVDGDLVTFKAGDLTLTLDLDQVKRGEVVDTVVFGAKAKGYDCGSAAAEWFSQLLYGGETEVRLLYDGELTERRARRAPYFNFTKIKDHDQVVYADTCAYMLASESSLEDLNTRLARPVTLDWFRANVIVQGSRAYDEDDWAYVRVGQEVVLRRIKPCDRCIFTIVDPSKGDKDPDQEPLKTLRKYRLVDGPEQLAKAWAAKPVFGSHLAIDRCGPVKVGDKVWVARASANPRWHY